MRSLNLPFLLNLGFVFSSLTVTTQKANACGLLVLITFAFNDRMGLRGRELMSSVGKVMLQGGGTFGTFMAIGTAIRC